jgi:uncharacterized repeat protein (TIGR03803 family)
MKNGVVKTLLLIGVGLFVMLTHIHGDILYSNIYLFDTTPFEFTLVNRGANPSGLLIQGTNGVFYGTTLAGGTNLTASDGVLFSATNPPNPVIPHQPVSLTPTLLHSFAVGEGAKPYAGVTFGPDGNLYGTTAFYAISNTLFPSGMGSIFGLRKTGFSRLYRFGTVLSSDGHPLDGACPRAQLVAGPGGSFFGTTYNGGTNGYANGGLGYGTVFLATTNGGFNQLHSFLGGDGANPTTLMLGSDTNLYGVASHGGSNTNVADIGGDVGFGVVFSMATNGTLVVLYSFGAPTNADGNPLDGAVPNSLVQGSDGAFYGTTAFGGSHTSPVDSQGNVGYGTIFQITTNGVFTSLYSFGEATNPAGVALDGANPVGPLVQLPDGNFYGVTTYGGVTNAGTIFRVTTNGTLITLFSFSATNQIFGSPPGFLAGTRSFPAAG